MGGEFWLSSSEFLTAQIKLRAISPTHKSETYTQIVPKNQGGWKARIASAGLSGTLELPWPLEPLL